MCACYLPRLTFHSLHSPPPLHCGQTADFILNPGLDIQAVPYLGCAARKAFLEEESGLIVVILNLIPWFGG